jgi:hypothetical protein
MSMNLRHAAALALVGWYMITPPFANASAPVAKWGFYNDLPPRTPNRPTDIAHAKEFDSKAACESKKAEILPTLSASSVRGGDIQEWIARHNTIASHTICVSSDDRRLKEK